MKNKIIKSFSVLISAILLISIMPFNLLKADTTQTYYDRESGIIDLGLDSRTNRYYKGEALSDTVRFVYYKVGTSYEVGACSTVSVNGGFRLFNAYSNSWGTNNVSTQYVYNGVTYYTYNTSTSSISTVSANIAFELPNGASGLDKRNSIVEYTYGNSAVGPEPPGPEYGSLKIGFSTSIAYSGGNSNAWRMNKDTIWFDQYDTLGNDLRGLNIELQAVPYSTEASTKQNLLGQKFNEFFYDTVRVGSLGFYSPGQNPIDFTWEYITNRFSPTWWSTYGENWSLTGWFLNEGWYKVGWAYRARVVDDELNTIIDWQWIYNATSVDAQDTENIINNTGYNPDLVNSINNINNINNTTNNNYYNNQTINYNSSEPTSSGSWIEEMIRGIFSTIGTLIEMIGGVFSDLITGLSDIIVELGVDVLGFFRDIFDSITGNNQQIDLTLPEFNLNQNDLGALNEFKKLTNGYVAIFINSGMWFVIVVPLVIMLLKVVIKWKS